MAKTLGDFFCYLDNLSGRASIEDLVEEMQELAIDCDDVAEFIRFHDGGYARNLMRSGDWYYALVLCWKNGQRSPIHNHAGSSCGVRVLRGTLTETKFAFAPNGLVVATGSRDLDVGEVCASQDADMHQISNLHAGGKDLVTLHIYSPPLVWMDTYSIYDRTHGRELFMPEFCDAAGI